MRGSQISCFDITLVVGLLLLLLLLHRLLPRLRGSSDSQRVQRRLTSVAAGHLLPLIPPEIPPSAGESARPCVDPNERSLNSLLHLVIHSAETPRLSPLSAVTFPREPNGCVNGREVRPTCTVFYFHGVRKLGLSWPTYFTRQLTRRNNCVGQRCPF